MSIFEERYLDKIAFVLSNAIMHVSRCKAILRKLNRNKKVKLINHLPNIKLPQLQKEKLKYIILQSIKQDRNVPEDVS
jgi:hypothetical protein